MIPKFFEAFYVVKSAFHIRNNWHLKTNHFVHFHSIITYGLIIWDNSTQSNKIFTLQKKTVTIMIRAKPRNPHRHLFKKLQFCLTHAITHFINERHCKHHTKHLQQIQLYVALIEEIVIIFTDQMSWHQNIQQFTTQT